MENGRYWPPIIVLFLAVACLFGFRYMEQIDAANAAVVDTKLALRQAKESLEGRKEVWAIVDAAAQKLILSQQKHKDANQFQTEADKKQRLVEGDLRYTITSLKSAVEKVRADAVGYEISEVVLLNGTIFKDAKIRKVDDNSISFFHSTGISSVQIEQIPQELVEKFDMGPRSLVVQLEQLEASLGNAVVPAKSEPAENPKLLAVRKRIAHLEIQINSTTAHKDKLEAEVRNYDNQIRSAEVKGSVPFSLRNTRDVAEGNAGTARNELKLLKTELEKLKLSERSLVLEK